MGIKNHTSASASNRDGVIETTFTYGLKIKQTRQNVQNFFQGNRHQITKDSDLQKMGNK